MQKCLNYLDLFSVKPNLYIHGNSRYITKTGASLTVITLITISILSIFFINSFFQKRDISVLSYSEFKPTNFTMELNQKPFMFKMIYIDENGRESPIDPTIATVEPRFMIGTKDKSEKIALEYEQCNFDKHLPNPIYKTKIFPQGVEPFNCIKPNKYNLTLSNLQNKFDRTWINVYLAECVNSTMNNNHCKPGGKISESLRSYNMYFNWIMPSVSIDHSNNKEPLAEYVIKSGNVKVFYDFLYVYQNYFKMINYSSDEGLVFEDFVNYVDYQYDSAHSQNLLNPRNSKLMVEKAFTVFQFFIIDSFYDSHKRTYPKFQTVMANIGGVMQAFMTIGQVVAYYLTNQMMIIELIAPFLLNDVKKQNSELHDILQKNVLSDLAPVQLSDNHKSNFKSKLSFCHAIFPKKCLPKVSAKYMLEKCEDFYYQKVSIENILNIFKEFHKLLKILFTDAESAVLHQINISGKENYESIKLENLPIENILSELNEFKEIDAITKRLISAFKKYQYSIRIFEFRILGKIFSNSVSNIY